MTRRPFARIHRPLPARPRAHRAGTEAVEATPGHAGYLRRVEAEIAALDRPTRGNRHSDAAGSVAADVSRILRGRTDFPREMISTEAGAH